MRKQRSSIIERVEIFQHGHFSLEATGSNHALVADIYLVSSLLPLQPHPDKIRRSPIERVFLGQANRINCIAEMFIRHCALYLPGDAEEQCDRRRQACSQHHGLCTNGEHIRFRNVPEPIEPSGCSCYSCGIRSANASTMPPGHTCTVDTRCEQGSHRVPASTR